MMVSMALGGQQKARDVLRVVSPQSATLASTDTLRGHRYHCTVSFQGKWRTRYAYDSVPLRGTITGPGRAERTRSGRKARQVKTRSGRGLVPVLLLSLLAAACQGRTDGAGPGSSETGGSETGGTIRVGIAELPPAMGDPAQHVGKPATNIWPAFYDGLSFINAEGEPEPALATEWQATGDTTWEFALRDDVAFSNGEPFNADAVVTAADNILFGYGSDALVRTNLLPTVTAVRAVDDFTVEFTTAEPDPLVPKRVAQFYPLPPAYFAEVGPEGFAQQPVGTGPFAVESWDPGRVVMTAFEESWRPPKVDRLEFIELPESTARRQALLSGQIDIAQEISPEDIPDVEASDATVVVGADPRVRMIGLFEEKEGSPVQSQEVRQALNYAVNKEELIDTFVNGVAPIATQVATENSTGYNPDLDPYPFDPDRARELLAEAGYPDGFDMLIEIVGRTESDRAIYEAIANYLADVGVNAEVRSIEFAEWREKLFSAGWAGDAFSFSVAFDPVFDISRAWPNITCQAAQPFFCDPEVTPLQEEASGELDPERRRELLFEIAELTHDNPPGILIDGRVQVDGLRGVQNYENPNLIVNWDELTITS